MQANKPFRTIPVTLRGMSLTVACVHLSLAITYTVLTITNTRLTTRQITPLTISFGAWVHKNESTPDPPSSLHPDCKPLTQRDSRSPDEFIQPITLSYGQLDARVIIIVFHILSFIFQGLNALDPGFYFNILDRGHTHLSHFIEYSFSASLMIMAIGVQLGVTDLHTLLGSFANTWACMIFGLFAEIMHENAIPATTWVVGPVHVAIKVHWAAHSAGWVALAFALSAIYSNMNTFGTCMPTRHIPEFVWAIVVVESILFCGFGLVQIVSFAFKPERGVNRVWWACAVELAYITLSLFAKTILGMLIFFAS